METIGVIWGLYRDDYMIFGPHHDTDGNYRDYNRVCNIGYLRITEKNMETTIVGFRVYWGIYRDNGKENGDYGGYVGAL